MEARRRLWGHPDLARLIPQMLFRMYCEARTTVPLLAAALHELKTRLADDPLAPGLTAYFEQLHAEERGHDDWLLDALEALGQSRASVLARLPPPTVAALVGTQYYWVHHHHPVALLGFAKVVEMDPPTVEQIDAIVARTDLPRGAFQYHLGHVHQEREHNELLDRVLDTLPLSPAHEALIGVSAARTVDLLGQSIEELVRLHDLAHPRAASIEAQASAGAAS